ncbi:hypothetical protein EKO27_g8973 [Xylaria grammica]|uniref:Uncharacterized protein n=1 Tax=Xylaria grammica TaxID=363999 RepID=A0A439CVD1_9PEZI|nr:hypothetical protein EKO27_g8973 [Xylaria grammica]
MAAQPDFNTVSTKFAEIGQESALCQNLPGVGNGIMILDGIRIMMNRLERRLGARIRGLDRRMGRLEGRMGRLEGRMDGLEGRMGRLEGQMRRLEGRMGGLGEAVKASEKNTLARIMNSGIVLSPGGNARLMPLYSSANEVVNRFPRTTAELNNMTGVALTAVLLQLGLPGKGGVAEKKSRLLFHSGVGTSMLNPEHQACVV